MEEILVPGTAPGQVCNAIIKSLGCTVEPKGNTKILTLKNNWGKGVIKCYEIRKGMSLILFEMHLNDTLSLSFCNVHNPLLLYICLCEGRVSFQKSTSTLLTPYQTTILGGDTGVKNCFQLEAGQKVKISFLMVDLHHAIPLYHLNFFSHLKSYFKKHPGSHFEHFGYLNVTIADQINTVNCDFDSPDSAALHLEGQALLILSHYIKAFHNFENQILLPDSLSEKDILKIYELSRYIQEHISEKITVKQLATTSGMNINKLQKGFKYLFNSTVNEYVRRKKMEVALECLHSNEYSISEIVYRIGWKSKSYFSKMFSEKYGMLPKEYRQTHQLLVKQAYLTKRKKK